MLLDDSGNIGPEFCKASKQIDEKDEGEVTPNIGDTQIRRHKLMRRSPIKRRLHLKRLAEENNVQEFALM